MKYSFNVRGVLVLVLAISSNVLAEKLKYNSNWKKVEIASSSYFQDGSQSSSLSIGWIPSFYKYKKLNLLGRVGLVSHKVKTNGDPLNIIASDLILKYVIDKKLSVDTAAGMDHWIGYSTYFKFGIGFNYNLKTSSCGDKGSLLDMIQSHADEIFLLLGYIPNSFERVSTLALGFRFNFGHEE